MDKVELWNIQPDLYFTACILFDKIFVIKCILICILWSIRFFFFQDSSGKTLLLILSERTNPHIQCGHGLSHQKFLLFFSNKFSWTFLRLHKAIKNIWKEKTLGKSMSRLGCRIPHWFSKPIPQHFWPFLVK